MNYFERVFQELATDKGANIIQNIFLTEQPFLSKISKSVCIWFQILHARTQSLKEPQVGAIESFSIEHNETIMQKCSK